MSPADASGLSPTDEVAFLVSGFHLAYRDEAARAARMWLNASRGQNERAVLASVVEALVAI